MVDDENKKSAEAHKNETGVGQDYSSILADALKKKDEEISAIKKSSAEQVKKLTEMIVNGQEKSEDQQAVVYTDKEIIELKKKVISEEGSNLDHAKAAVELYDACKQKGLPNPFVPTGVNYTPDGNDDYRSENTIESFRECIEIANGDSEIFQRELVRRTKGR